MKNIYDYTLEELEEIFKNKQEPKFRASQVFEWIYKKRELNIDNWSNVKKETKEWLKKEINFEQLKIVTKQKSKEVVKYLFELQDKELVEAVVMFHDYGYSLCVSTQVGCNMGCKFCESGRLKKIRNLNTFEMVLQILQIEEDLNLRISHVVLMGIGEPFDNYTNVLKFIRVINSNIGINIGARHITVSTCGIVPKIKKFMNEGIQVNLAVSLHASNDELRTKLMPINKVYPLKELINSLKEYILKTNRRVTFEYILLKGINDQKKHALELVGLLKGMNAYVNLIPYNETSHIEFKRTKETQILTFYDILKKNNIGVTIRREFGLEIDAACGQLRSIHEEEK